MMRFITKRKRQSLPGAFRCAVCRNPYLLLTDVRHYFIRVSVGRLSEAEQEMEGSTAVDFLSDERGSNGLFIRWLWLRHESEMMDWATTATI